MAASSTPQKPLLEHVEAPSAEVNAPTREPAPADEDLEGAREEEQAERAHAAVYARFSDRQKRVILALVSFAGLTQSARSSVLLRINAHSPTVFVSSSFITSIPAVAREVE